MSRDGFGGAPSAPPVFPEPAEAARAFEALRAEIRALRPEELRPMNFDARGAVAIALAAEPRIVALRPLIVAQAPATPIASVDDLRKYIYGAYYGHLIALPTVKTEPEKKALLDEAGPLRKELLLGAEALASKGLVDGALVAKVRSGKGRSDVADDLVALSAAWAEIEDKTAVTAEEVERAGVLGTRLLLALSRDPVPAVEDETQGELRARAFTLLVKHYDECRRAVAYVRFHEGDADRVAPSLFKRAAKPKKVEAPAE